MKVNYFLLACLLASLISIPEFASAANGASGCARSPKPDLQIDTAGNTDTTQDSVSYSISGQRLKVIVLHRRGIGKASISLVHGRWPTRTEVVFRDFSELEELAITVGKKQTVINSKAPSSSQRPFALKRKKRQICLVFPHSYLLHEGGPLNLRWIDYYR